MLNVTCIAILRICEIELRLIFFSLVQMLQGQSGVRRMRCGCFKWIEPGKGKMSERDCRFGDL